MAGGRSLRMRASLGAGHKALVEILGLSMLERNIRALLSHGIQEIVVAISSREKALAAFALGRGAQLARAGGAKLGVHIEKRPLGTIGAAREIRAGTAGLLVVNVDNLTSLDLTALMVRHQATRAAMTIATHTEPFPVPFGQVSIRNGRITAYKEKPVLPVLISSGTYVLSSAAVRKIPTGRSVDAPELVHILLRKKQRISAFPHSSPWIDVNDSASVERAEALIMANSQSFEVWRQPPNRELVALAIIDDKKVALSRVERRGTPLKSGLPLERHLAAGEVPVEAAARLANLIGLTATAPQLVASFDDLDLKTRSRTRCHLYACVLTARRRNRFHSLLRRFLWFNVDHLSQCRKASRKIAYLERCITSKVSEA